MSEATSTQSKTLLPLFSGSYKEYDTWRLKFFARANSRTGWTDILTEIQKLPAGSDTDFMTMVEKEKVKNKPGTEEDTSSLAGIVAAKAAKAKALMPEEAKTLQQAKNCWSNLVNTMEDDTALRLVKVNSGNPHEAMIALDRKYKPRTMIDLGNLQKRYQNWVLTPGGNTDGYINVLEDLRTKIEDFGQEISEEAFMLQVLNKIC